MTILSQCQSGTWKLINSSALISELNQTPDLERLQNVKKLLLIAKIKVIILKTGCSFTSKITKSIDIQRFLPVQKSSSYPFPV
jgi:hypothetical protein